jgi:ligand-binding sensor domain-containing protein/signal transduction histidine kinase
MAFVPCCPAPTDSPVWRSRCGARRCRERVAGLLALLCGLLLTPTSVAAAEAERSYAVTTWRTKDGLPSDRVRRLLQDSAGFLWIATFNGVARFDGVRFRRYDVANTPALPNNLVNALFEDRAGRIWLGHETGEISVWDRGQFHVLAMDSEWKGSPIDQFAESRDGTLFVINRKGWLRPIRALEPGPILREHQGASIRNLVSDEAGQIWVTGSRGIYRYDPERNQLRSTPDVEFTELPRPHLLPARGGGLWVIGTRAARRWHEGRWTGESFATELRRRTPTNTWIQLADGRLAASTLDEGLRIFSREGGSLRLDMDSGLPANFVIAVVQDREGNLWLGAGDLGLCRLRPRLVEMVVPPGGWQNRAVQAVIATREGAVWAGTEGHGVFRLQEGGWTHFDRSSGLTLPVVKTLFEDRAGRLWAGLANGGFGYFEQERYRGSRVPTGLSAVFAMFQSSDGRFWLGGNPGVFCLEGDRPVALSAAFSRITRVSAFGESADKVLWIASLGSGLGRYQAGELKVFSRADGLPSEYLWSLHPGRDDTLWIGTYDRGLVRMKAGRFALIDTARGLPGNMVGQILEGDDGDLWVGTNGGIARLAREELDACAEGRRPRVAAKVFDQSDGLATLGLAGGLQSAAARTRDGVLWFATEGGLARIDPRSTPPRHPAPPVVIEAVRADGVEHPAVSGDAGKILILPPGSRRVEIDYTGLSLAAPQRLRFRYRLEGAERGWTEVGSQRTAYLGYLRPGNYTFRVQAETGAGADSVAGEAGVRLRISPFFWETTWFVSLAAVTALLLVAGIVFAVVHTRHRRRLEQIARQQAIERDRTRIAHDLHDEIGSGLTQLSILSHAALAAAAQPGKSAGHLREIQQTTTEMTEAIDEIVWAVNPRHDSLESLLAYLGRVVQASARRAGLQCHIDVPLDLGPLEVTAEYRHELYLALREALNNVSKHAGATAVWFAVRRDGEEYLFRLEDNGCGFAAAGARPNESRRGGLGRESMANRLARLGGALTCSDRPGGGAVVEFRIRLRPPAKQ